MAVQTLWASKFQTGSLGCRAACGRPGHSEGGRRAGGYDLNGNSAPEVCLQVMFSEGILESVLQMLMTYTKNKQTNTRKTQKKQNTCNRKQTREPVVLKQETVLFLHPTHIIFSRPFGITGITSHTPPQIPRRS